LETSSSSKAETSSAAETSGSARPMEEKGEKEKKKRIVFEFEDEQLYDQVKGQIEDLKKD